MSTIRIAGVDYPGVPSVEMKDPQGNVIDLVIPEGTKTITENGTGIDIAGFAQADVAVEPKIAWGFAEPEYEEAFTTLLITGIVDAQGNSFEPNGFALILRDDSATTHTYASNGVIAVVKASSDESPEASRVTLYGSTARTIRTNPTSSGITFGDGWARYNTGTSAYYLQPGNWLWVAWRS